LVLDNQTGEKMSGFSFPNDSDDKSTRLAYTVAAEFIYRLDEFLADAHKRFDYWSLPAEMVKVVKVCASFGSVILSHTIEAPAVIVHLSEEETHCSCSTLHIFQQSTVDLAIGAVKAVAAAQGAVALGQHCSTPAKARMMTAFATSFFYMLGELCEQVDELDDDLVEDSDVRMLRGYIDAALGMLSELNSVNWSEEQPVPADLVEALGKHLDSYQLEAAGRNAEYAASYVYEAVMYG
jgi:hypothetical protein